MDYFYNVFTTFLGLEIVNGGTERSQISLKVF